MKISLKQLQEEIKDKLDGSGGIEVAIQDTEPTDKNVKLWVIPSYEREVEIEVPVEGSETGETTTETYIETVPAAILYQDADGKFRNMDSIAGAPGADGADGFSPIVTLEDLLNDDSKKVGVKLSITDKDSTKSTNILNGAKGDRGVGITSIDKTGTAGLVDTYTITFSDNTTTTFNITNASSVEKLSQLENDSGFITDTVNNLVNYYTKEQTYTKEEVADLLSSISAGLSTEIVTELPDAATEDISLSTIYLLRVGDSNVYTQYMWISKEWANLGTTAVNLDNYYIKSEIDTRFGLYITTTALLSILDNYVKTADLAKVATSGDYNDLKNIPTIPDLDGLASTAYVDNKAAEIEEKIPDTSDFRKKTDTIQYSEISGTPKIDASISATSENAVQNKVIAEAIEKLQYYQPGETLTLGGTYYSGLISSAQKEVQFFIPLPRSILKRTVVINTPWTINIRSTPRAYLLPVPDGSSYQYGNFTSAAYGNKVSILTSRYPNGLRIILHSDAGWYNGKNSLATNNIPVAVELQVMNIKFT